MDLREQKYVCALAECGNLTRAAERLFISPPALSIYIANLEKNMGIPLFDRSGKKFVLTYAGEQYVETAERMLKLEQEFNAKIYDVVQEMAGRLRLGVLLRRGSWLVPPVAAEFEEKWPDIDLVIREGNLSELNELMKNSELDLAILNKVDVPEDMESHILFQEEFLVAVPVNHSINQKAEADPGERYKKIKPEYLNGETLILHKSFQSGRGIEDEIIKRHHIKPGKIREIRSVETAYQMAAEGLGICFVREGYAVNLAYKKPVNYYILDMEQHLREVHVAYRRGLRLPDYMEDMIRILENHGRHFLET